MKFKQLFSLFFLLSVFAFTGCGNASDGSEAEQETTTEMETTAPNYGLALYTLRDTLAKDPKGVLKYVAEVGYKNIESAGYEDGKFYGMAPAEFKAYLEEIGLTPLSSHNSGITMENMDQTIADVKAAGFQYLVIPVPPMGHFKFDPETRKLSMSEDLEEVMGIINMIAEKCQAAGLQCLYHNHNFEFEENANGVRAMDYFIEHSNPENLKFEMDLYWVTNAGVDPIDYFKKAPGRIIAWHVKDMDNEGRFAPVGEGKIDFKRILAEKDLSGMEFYFVEQDATFNHTPMEAIKISFDGLQDVGFE